MCHQYHSCFAFSDLTNVCLYLDDILKLYIIYFKWQINFRVMVHLTEANISVIKGTSVFLVDFNKGSNKCTLGGKKQIHKKKKKEKEEKKKKKGGGGKRKKKEEGGGGEKERKEKLS